MNTISPIAAYPLATALQSDMWQCERLKPTCVHSQMPQVAGAEAACCLTEQAVCHALPCICAPGEWARAAGLLQVDKARKAVTCAAIEAYDAASRIIGLSTASMRPELQLDTINQAVWLKIPSKLVCTPV